ncbi:hypothetical protein [Mediterraneibacter faecis]|uniref:hypothetical protein n=1 Tax=Mediterraneibacter faecis TaxID=592978 RepID=UPI0022DFF5E6|nr:hypothetical protein [Mediterraneibacter faecis]
MINMKCPICGKDLDLQNKQIGTSENGDPIFNEYAICHSCKKQWNLDKQRAKKIAAKKAAEEKAKAEAEARAAEEKAKAEAAARAAEEKAKAEAAARAAEEKAKAEAAARAAEEKAKAKAAARAAEEKRAARREAKARARKEAIARLAADKGISEEEAERILKERARARKAAAQKAATDATATDNSEEQKYGNIPAEEIRDKREKAVRKGYEDMLATDPDSKAAKKKKKEETETAKAKEDVKSRKMDDYDDAKSSDDEDDDEYEYVDEYPRFRPGRIILGIISLLAFGFCIYKGFVTGLSTSGADVTSAPGMNYVIVALCMLITALLYFIMNNRDTLFAFLIPMIVYIGSAVFAFLKHGDEFELLILAGASGVLAVISLILAIASRGGDDYDDEDDYDDPFEEEHDN